MDYLEIEGTSIDEAIGNGLKQLGVPRDKAAVEILAVPKKGFFGLGAQKARIRITLKRSATTNENISSVTGSTRLPVETPTAAGDFFSNVFEPDYWRHHFYNTVCPVIEPMKPIMAPDLIPHTWQLLEASLGSNGLVGHLRRTEKTGKVDIAYFYVPKLPVLLMITGLPWYAKDLARNLGITVGEPGYGYGKYLAAILSKPKPSGHLTHWAHLLICMVDGGLYFAAGEWRPSGNQKIYCFSRELVTDMDSEYFRDSTPISVPGPR